MEAYAYEETASSLSQSESTTSQQAVSNPAVAYIHSKEFEAHLNKHPRLYGTVTVTHNLIKAYQLLDHVTVIQPNFATVEELKSFHSEEYIDFLKKINDLSEEELLDEEEEEMEKYGIGYDCPFIPQIFDAASMIGGATVTAAKALLSGEYQIAVNWGGGWHHAKKDQADGFCYVNDIVLGILQLLKKYKRVLYVDLDLHHGDGVEEAFAHTSRVLCFSIHKNEIGFYPGTGLLNDIGYGKGKHYTINVPLYDGIQDSQYIELIIPLLSKTQKKFQPDIVVCQCGADTLAGDPFAAFNLTLKAPAECIKLLKSWNIPLLALGGGGYNAVNTARCWTYLLSILLDKTVESDIPDHKYLMKYGPDYEIQICPRTMPNRNSTEHLKLITDTVLKNIDYIQGPSSDIAAS
ncbi:histone deacetylase 8-like [Argiope bruennichi]|uniref:Histone deacetylase n=1 Tax=Argiope bruennichi TaxID=94029 RepID=A0A8T0F7S8_ARGBR|nr:histone deacetylase 8-like [Argiope bruennichi]KAF8786285.1 Histone deacetylase 8 like protein [Argiope bruennichi]